MGYMMKNEIMKYFRYEHLKGDLMLVSQSVAMLARDLEREIPDCEEKTAGLRKLLEAKDCFVRAKLGGQQ